MAIFSNRPRTEPGIRSFSESSFQFLDRIAGPFWDQVRDLVEDWYSRLPPDAQPGIRGRLRSEDGRQFAGAFLELYVHQCLIAMGYTVTCHPELHRTKRRPDFLAEKDGKQTYIEARSTSASDAALARSARAQAVHDSVNKIHSPNFVLWMDIDRHGSTPLASRLLRRELEAWLANLDPDRHMLEAGKRRADLPEYSYESGGWKIRFWAVGKKAQARGKPGSRPLGIYGGTDGFYPQDDQLLRRALSDKGTAYGKLDAAFVVVIASASITLDDHDVITALYGSEHVQLATAADGAEVMREGRKPDGYWYRGDRWDHRGVSAILVINNLYPAFIGRQQHTIWQHPAPRHPVDAFGIWRRAINNHGEIEYIEPERTHNQWFDLTDPWPTGEAFPRQ